MIIPPHLLPSIDFIVEGSVAVSLECGRIGKGEGHAELEYTILREFKLVDDLVPIATTVHDIQVFENFPQDIYNVPVDYIGTPTHLITCAYRKKRPQEIYWNLLGRDEINKILILKTSIETKKM